MNVADNGDDQIQTDRGQQVIQAQNVDVWEAILAAGIVNKWMWGHMGALGAHGGTWGTWGHELQLRERERRSV